LQNRGFAATDVNSRTCEEDTSLHLAVKTDKIEVVRQLLEETDIDTNIKNMKGKTPMEESESKILDISAQLKMLNATDDEWVTYELRYGLRRMEEIARLLRDRGGFEG
jgi:hypothetical protein